MSRSASTPVRSTYAVRPLRLGFLALNDAAPLIVAHEHGLFREAGLSVELSREIGWATVRDKIIYGELDAAQALAGLLLGTRLGLDCQPCEVLTACVLSVHGNAITLSEQLWQEGVRDAATFRDAVLRTRHQRPRTLGVVSRYSTHQIHLCDWLRSAGIHPLRDVRIVVVPPPQVFRNLLAGNIDGYCVGEPWNSLAIRENIGWCPALSRDLNPGHPEKVLMVRTSFANERAEEHLALVAALTRASALCDNPAFRPELAQLLSRREYLNVPARVLESGLTGPFLLGHGTSDDAADLVKFHRDGANDPRPAQAAWLIDRFRRHGLILPGTALPRNLARDLFRTDLFHQACQRHDLPVHHEIAQS